MGIDEIKEIADIVGGDKTYAHFVKRINKEFEAADEERNSKVFVIFVKDENGEKVGFSVIGHSPPKMKLWQKTFRDEGWVSEDFSMSDIVHELMYMYVKPNCRGEKISHRLFKKTFSFVKKKNVQEVYAYVGDRTPAALNFYKKMNAHVISDFSDEESSAAFLKWNVSDF